MKAAVEYGLIFLIGCFMLSLLIQFTGVIAQIHKGHLYLNYIMHLTENYDGNLEDVSNHAASNDLCANCTFTHSKMDDRFEIQVSFPIRLQTISFNSRMRITGITSPFES